MGETRLSHEQIVSEIFSCNSVKIKRSGFVKSFHDRFNNPFHSSKRAFLENATGRSKRQNETHLVVVGSEMTSLMIIFHCHFPFLDLVIFGLL